MTDIKNRIARGKTFNINKGKCSIINPLRGPRSSTNSSSNITKRSDLS
jgi:hypothetical protein